ncbi:MAG: hypothetical protein AAF982_02730 [Pseudomonadota bacterium]
MDHLPGVYASRAYLDRAGQSRDPSALKTHALVGYVEDLVYTPELDYAGDVLRDWQSDIETSTAIGQFEAGRGSVSFTISRSRGK